MIVMVVASPSEEESGYICICSRGLTGQLSDEKLEDTPMSVGHGAGRADQDRREDRYGLH